MVSGEHMLPLQGTGERNAVTEGSGQAEPHGTLRLGSQLDDDCIGSSWQKSKSKGSQ